MAVRARVSAASVSGRWAAYAAVAAGALLAAAAVGGAPKALALAIALGLPAFVLLLRMGRHRAVVVSITLGAFFSGAPVKIGQFDISDLFLLLTIVFLVLGSDPAEPSPLPRGVVGGLCLIVVGGFVGSLFQPARSPFSTAIAVLPS